MHALRLCVGGVEALLQLADEVAAGELQLAHLAGVRWELAWVVALDHGDERPEHLAGVAQRTLKQRPCRR